MIENELVSNFFHCFKKILVSLLTSIEVDSQDSSQVFGKKFGDSIFITIFPVVFFLNCLYY